MRANIRGHFTPTARLNKTVENNSIMQHHFFALLLCRQPVWAKRYQRSLDIYHFISVAPISLVISEWNLDL